MNGENWLLVTNEPVEGHFTHEPRAATLKIVRAQKKASKGRPKAPSNHVVWSWIPKCSVKSYVIGPSTKCYFNEFLFMIE